VSKYSVAIAARNGLEGQTKLEAAAGPAPWRWVEETYGSGPWSYTACLEDGDGSALASPTGDAYRGPSEIVVSDEDKALIVHARNDDSEADIDALVEEVRYLRDLAQEYRQIAVERRLHD